MMKKTYQMPSINVCTLQSVQNFTTSDIEDGLDFGDDESGE